MGRPQNHSQYLPFEHLQFPHFRSAVLRMQAALKLVNVPELAQNLPLPSLNCENYFQETIEDRMTMQVMKEEQAE